MALSLGIHPQDFEGAKKRWYRGIKPISSSTDDLGFLDSGHRAHREEEVFCREFREFIEGTEFFAQIREIRG